ncbi:MAG TPA: tRNA 2-thiouridine(34) synthase MnmA [Acidimicrobiia bacterium]|nr:tRNA 2-thiouridine(34) synthase MnmA [Acidimicrobiia bacterium]
MRVLVAMSGGVDSSVAAAAMVEQGHDVIGVTLKQWEGPDGRLPTSGCCTVADAEDARRVASRLGIPYYVLDYTEQFGRDVVARFGEGYLAGRTPNPCIECNRRVRFGALLDRVEDLGCDVLVTGHHARVDHVDGRFRLLVGKDGTKDQSYVLHMLGQAELARTMLPIGEMTKDAVRAEADRLGLRTATKPDSQDLCFVQGDYRQFLREHFPETARPGEIVDADGSVLGSHDGVSGFTVGQRRGLGVSLGEPRYVVGVDAGTSTVTLGRREDLAVDGCRVEEVSFVGGVTPSDGLAVDVKVRYRSHPAPGSLHPDGDAWQVRFDRPQEGVAPGQAAVFYLGDEVLGGGTIVSAA